ncbi:Peptide methionine sulfoxide reductase MsrA [Frankliniella fusca]|uniref:Peptide methionine sulfoxide reductase MsrA n=1 Tax=Frankliniella fusca TaxID=407009 RepID=A0AAE1LIW2_9NEOP|nr:Peptide methionine sulfoxide reductase MsrA [Frankliniella fusca]
MRCGKLNVLTSNVAMPSNPLVAKDTRLESVLGGDAFVRQPKDIGFRETTISHAVAVVIAELSPPRAPYKGQVLRTHTTENQHRHLPLQGPYSHDFRSACLVLFRSRGTGRVEGILVTVLTMLSKISSSPSEKKAGLAVPPRVPLALLLTGVLPLPPAPGHGAVDALHVAVAHQDLPELRVGAHLRLALELAHLDEEAHSQRVCSRTRSRVVRYSSANSDTMRQNSLGLVSGRRASGTPTHSRKRWKRFMTRRCTTLSTMMRSAQSARKSDILDGGTERR